MDNKIKFTCATEYETLPAPASKELFLTATLQAPQFDSEERSSRAPLDVICVIDRSGSMAGSKIELVKATLQFMVSQLKRNDRLSVVTFDDFVTTEFELTAMDESGKAKAVASIAKLKAGSSTNLSGGLLEALNKMRLRADPHDVSSILLFTDGLANRGITNTTQIVRSMEAMMSKIDRPCTLYTFGFGADHDAAMLKALADSGNGLYYFLETEDAIPDSFGECLGGLLSVTSQNITLTIQPQGDVRLTRVVSNYKGAAAAAAGSAGPVTLNIGDLYSEEKKDIVFVAHVPSASAPLDRQELVKVALSYMNVLDSSFETTDIIVAIARPADPSAELRANRDVDMQRNRVETAEALLQSSRAADQGRMDEARTILARQLEKVHKSPTYLDPFCQGLATDIESCMHTLGDRETYRSTGSKVMNTIASVQMKQRGKAARMFTPAYETSRTTSMAKQFVSHVQSPHVRFSESTKQASSDATPAFGSGAFSRPVEDQPFGAFAEDQFQFGAGARGFGAPSPSPFASATPARPSSAPIPAPPAPKAAEKSQSRTDQ